MEQPYASRRERAQTRLQERGADGAVAYPGPNLQYFTGFRGEPVDRFHALYLPAEGEATLVTPDGYHTQARTNASVEAFRTVPGNDPAAVAGALAELFGDGDRLLVDDDALHALTGPLYAELGAESVESAAPLFRALRRRKDESEVTALKRSAAVADEVSEAVRALGAEAVGLTEAELATEIRAELHTRGARSVAFDVVVGSGPNGADPALRFSDREIRASEPVVVDFGCFLDGYASDQTRTVVFDGDPPARFPDVHEAVLAALDAGVDAVEPGATAGDVDAAVRETLADRGYGDRFTHPTGHGVGLASHEDLSIAEGEETTLEAGMVFSVEPGVYFEGEFGVRIEDLVVVTEDGCERLNDSPRTWEPL
jgi:Xaa-Pro aminopeptidase